MINTPSLNESYKDMDHNQSFKEQDETESTKNEFYDLNLKIKEEKDNLVFNQNSEDSNDDVIRETVREDLLDPNDLQLEP